MSELIIDSNLISLDDLSNSIESIVFTKDFNSEIDEIQWPLSLKSIKFINMNHFFSLDNIQWPNTLQYLEIGIYYNQPVRFNLSLLQIQKVIFHHPIPNRLYIFDKINYINNKKYIHLLHKFKKIKN